MATLTGTLYTTDGLGILASSSVSAYPAASQPNPPLVDKDGLALPPVGAAVATATSDTHGAFTLSGLTVATPYHLYVVNSDKSAFWLYFRMPDATASVTPCVLYGAEETAALTAGADLIQAYLEQTAVLTGGIIVTAVPISAPISQNGTFSLSLWPTSALLPQSVYRVVIGSSVWRGTIPAQAALSFSAWTALSTTVRLS